MADDRPVRDVNDMMEPEAGSGIRAGAVVTLVALALLVIFIIQNTNEANITFLTFDATTPLWVLAVVFFVLGTLVGYFVKARRVRRKRKEAAAKVG
jgi:uncharacterized integral membrane protein